jgi:L,D-peptidoglycan transpeptidase YkuD (ErfK/YbiS/YcfS/YnhG family)
VRTQNLPQNRQEITRKRISLRLFAKSGAAAAGILAYGNLQFPAAVGKGGMRARKREGDGATPLGVWRLLWAYYRPDRVARPKTALPLQPLRRDFGWCDAPADRNYNRKVALPYPASAERLWRDDRLYDVIVVLDYNLEPRAKGRGSAIFLHVARPGLAPTEGCIALKYEHLLRLLAALKPKASVAAATRVNAGAAGSGKGRSPAFRGRALWRRSTPHASAGSHGAARRR